jgi:integrase
MSIEDSWFTVDRTTGKRVQAKRHGRGKRWRVRNRGARTVSFHKRSDADAYDTTVKADLLRGVTPFDHAAGRVTFAEYATKWLREHHYDSSSRSTVGSLLDNHLLPAFGEKQMRDVRPSTVTAWLAEMRDKRKRDGQPYAASTISGVNTTLVSIMRAALVDKVIAVNPCDGVARPPAGQRRVVTVWEQDTVHALLTGLPDRQYPVPLLAATCGHRQGEAFGLARGDVNFLRRQVTIRHQVKSVDGQLVLVPPKGRKVRTVPLPEVTFAALAAHLGRYPTVTVRCQCCGIDNEVLFTGRGRLLSKADFNREVWHPALTGAGITPSRATGMHQLRHFYASTLIDGGASMKQVQEYMGHASIAITGNIYGHLFERSHGKAVAIIDAAFSARVYRLRTGHGQ